MTFSARPGDIYGMGDLSANLAQTVRNATILAKAPVDFSYKGDGAFDNAGLIDTVGIDDAVAIFGSMMASRLTSRSVDLDAVGYELKRASWRYSSTDRTSADKLADSHSKIENYGGYTGYNVDPVNDATTFPAGDSPDVELPAHRESDIRSIIDSSKGILTDIDKNIKEVTAWLHDNVGLGPAGGWSPLEQLIGPLAGNWAELERAGECFSKAGTAAEALASTLKAGNSQLASSWTGKAADAYQDHGLRLANAMAWEGSIGRIAKAVLDATSQEIKDATKTLLDYVNKKVKEELIDKGLKDVFAKVSTSLIPGVGWLFRAKDLYDLGKAIWEIYQHATETLDKMKQVIADAKAVIEALQNPQDAAAKELQGRIDKLKDRYKVDERKQQLELGIDIINAADVSKVTNAPKDKYTAPTGTQAWED
ncbi:hypothetical protein F3087_02645 [Nocardia colli]|uniref:WXG100 family type VII secretion target n=1 Tax=Nocardia colli TaxID=2545717 RepID=A0A5N0EMY3_9NOCA|nr:hypothetical protein [Nocardia colli]KAA8890226.1 hypothetical protein F3087_02645 [Nocardia colli]